MWQRIQTLYLAIATALMATMLFSVKAVIPGAEGAPDQTVKYIAYIPYLILLIIICLLDLLALTTWKFRIFQMRTAVLAAIITLALQAWLAVDYFTTSDAMVFRFTAVFPAVAVILDLLGARAILADQMMVESFSSLRSRGRRRRKKK